MVLNIDFKNDLYIAFDFINNKSLNEDVFKFIVKHKDLEPEFYYYINYTIQIKLISQILEMKM